MIDSILLVKEHFSSEIPGIIKIRARRKQMMGITSVKFETSTIISEYWNYPEFIEGDSDKEEEIFLKLLEKCGTQGNNNIICCEVSRFPNALKAMRKILADQGMNIRTILYKKDLEEHLEKPPMDIQYFPIKGTKELDFAVLSYPQTVGVITRDEEGKFAMGIFSYPVVIGKIVPS